MRYSILVLTGPSAAYSSGTSTALHMRAVPVRFGAQYAYPLGRRLSLLVEGGAGLYFTRLQWSDRTEVYDLARITELRSETSGYDIGFHGRVSLDVGLSDHFGLVAGVQAVHANIGGLKGYREGNYSYTSGTRDDGTLKVVGPEWNPDFHFLVVVMARARWIGMGHLPTRRMPASVSAGCAIRVGYASASESAHACETNAPSGRLRPHCRRDPSPE